MNLHRAGNEIMTIFNFVSENEELLGTILWPYLRVNDIVSLSMVSKEFENICIAINERVQQLINIREHGEYKALYMTPINQIKSINRMLNLFPNITNITFGSSSKMYREKEKFYDSDYWEYRDIRILSILYSSKQLQKTLLVLSLPIRCGIELEGIGSLTNLTKLEIFQSEIMSNQLCKEIKKLNFLTSLTLNACPNLTNAFLIDSNNNYLFLLTELDLTGCRNICGFNNWLIPHFLRTLNLSMTMITASDLKCICRLAVHLVSLNLDHCSRLDLSNFVTESGDSHFSSRLLEFKILSLKCNRTIREITLLTNLKSLTYLDLEGCEKIFMNHGLQHLSSLQNLTMLNIDNCNITDDMMKDDFPNLPNLQILDLSHMSFNKSYLGLHSHRLEMLKSLKLINCHYYKEIKSFAFYRVLQNITFLDISHGHSRVEESQIYNLACLTDLTTLILTSTFDTITHLGFQLLSNLTNLLSLSIQNSTISGSGLSQYLSKLCRISLLELTNCKLMDGNGSVDFSKFPCSLTYLDVMGFNYNNNNNSRSRSSSHSIVMESILSLQALKFLDISLCDDINDDDILRLSGSLTNLESLSLYKCYNLTDIGLSRLSSLVSLKHLVIDDQQFDDNCVFRLESLSQKGLRIELR